MKKMFCMIMVAGFVFLSMACSSEAVSESPASQVAEETVSLEPEKIQSASPAEEVVFADPVLEERVRAQIGKPEGPITFEEAQAVTSLDLDNKNNDPDASIKDLSGLENFKNVTALTISQNAITDLAPIRDMNLELFYSMNGNPDIKDFSMLKNSTDMLDLTILGNANINDSNIGFIADMTLLEMLWIQDATELSDISAVADFSNLNRLILINCNISDVSPIAGLENLKVLDLEGNPIEDYSPLADIYPNLEEKDFEID